MTASTPSNAPAAPSAVAGIVLVTLGYFMLTVNDTIAKLLTETYSTGQIVLFRSVFGLLPAVFLIRREPDGWRSLRVRRWDLHLLRGASYAGAAGTIFFALSQLSLAEAYVILFLAPLFITALSAFLLGERVDRFRWAAVAVGFCGVLAILLPDLLGGSTGFAGWGAAAALAGAFFYALTMVLVRLMGRTETGSATFVWGIALVGVFSLPMIWIGGWVRPTAMDFLLLAALGLIGGVAFLLLTEAFRLYSPALLAPFEYSTLLWGVLFGYWFWSDLPAPTLWVGAAIIIGSGLAVVRRERRLALAAARP